jgi:competence protein ComEC
MLAAPFSGSLSILFNNTNWLLTKIILGSVHLFALIPGGHLYVEHPHWPTRADLEINVLDLNAGGTIHIQAGRSDWIFDTGSQRDYDRVVRQYLRSRGIERLDGIALTHGDAAHMGGAAAALLDFRPRQLIDTATRDRSLVHRRLIADLARKNHPRRLCVAGDEFSLTPDCKAKILFPPAGFQGNRADDQALVIQLAVRGKSRAILMSDSGIATEEFLLKHYPNLRSEILVKGQHHTGFSGSDKFLDAVQPQAIVATSRDFPKNERLSDDWVEGLTTRGIKLFRQDQTGAVQLRSFRDYFEARIYVTGETFCSTRR